MRRFTTEEGFATPAIPNDGTFALAATLVASSALGQGRGQGGKPPGVGEGETAGNNLSGRLLVVGEHVQPGYPFLLDVSLRSIAPVGVNVQQVIARSGNHF